LNFNNIRTTYKDSFRCSGVDFCSIWWFVFLNFWPLLLWGAITFSTLFFLGIIFNAPKEGFKFCLDTKNNGAFLLDLVCLEHLNVIVAIQLQLNLQLMSNEKFNPYVLSSNPMLQTIETRFIIPYSHFKIQVSF